MRVALSILLLSASFAFAEDSTETFLIQEYPPKYWYCPIGAPNCFWYSLFHDRYNCKEFKPFHGKPCDINDFPIEPLDPCRRLPMEMDIGFCYERFWEGEEEDHLPLGD